MTISRVPIAAQLLCVKTNIAVARAVIPYYCNMPVNLKWRFSGNDISCATKSVFPSCLTQCFLALLMWKVYIHCIGHCIQMYYPTHSSRNIACPPYSVLSPGVSFISCSMWSFKWGETYICSLPCWYQKLIAFAGENWVCWAIPFSDGSTVIPELVMPQGHHFQPPYIGFMISCWK